MGFGLLAGLHVSAAQAQDLVSTSVRVIDGDTLKINGETLRLHGIDAPELAQKCITSTGKTWACGQQSKAHLKSLTDNSTIRCTRRERDAYDRIVSICYVGKTDLNADMVRSGQALAFAKYSADYTAQEAKAAAQKTGVWSGYFERPWDYRASKWQAANQHAPKGCPIKGNISKAGRIYHTPWSAHYARTRINEAAGERWFCSEEEAIAAGWRAPASS
ncbi:MAG: thermonuclease family protein [Rhodobacteraceae bacterium]|nr:thermonuclease family protein [Paracoccaceae bacterium]